METIFIRLYLKEIFIARLVKASKGKSSEENHCHRTVFLVENRRVSESLTPPMSGGKLFPPIKAQRP